jgi:hypothetical protein
LGGPELNDNLPNTDEVYKKKVLRKYLDGEIDRSTMNTMLSTFEKDETREGDTTTEKTKHDMAYH